MEMFSTLSWNSYPVGVRNLIKERQKYLFHSLLTKIKTTIIGWSSLFFFGSGTSDELDARSAVGFAYRSHKANPSGAKLPRYLASCGATCIMRYSRNDLHKYLPAQPYPSSAAKKQADCFRNLLFSVKSAVGGRNPPTVDEICYSSGRIRRMTQYTASGMRM